MASLPIQSIREMELQGKAVFLRLDLNVPIAVEDHGLTHVGDDNRIQEALPTIRLALEKGAKLIIASHLGRPKGGKKEPEYSLEPVAYHLAKLLDQDVTLADDCVGEGIELMVQSLKPGQILMLENLRFHAGEEKNDPEFCTRLSRLAEVYITDAFGTAHRKHASTYGLPSIMQTKGMGLLIEKELHYLSKLMGEPEKPFALVLGGAKVSDKIKTIESLLRSVDLITIGGLMANSFKKAKNEPIPEGAKEPGQPEIDAAAKILKEANRKNIPIVLPIDSNQGNDIGPKTIQLFSERLSAAKTVFWNGPLGWFERPEFAVGTNEVAKFLGGLSGVMKVVGGGDTVAAIKTANLASGFDHLSTGGGAVLEYLEEGSLPGIEILRLPPKTGKHEQT